MYNSLFTSSFCSRRMQVSPRVVKAPPPMTPLTAFTEEFSKQRLYGLSDFIKA